MLNAMSFLDKEQRKMNLVIHNMQESSGENARERASKDADKFKVMIREGFKLVVHTTKCFRVGKKNEDKPRLLIVTLDDREVKYEILRHARDLRNTEEYGNIFITPDQTKMEREQGKKTRDELARRRNAGENDLVIWRGKIVKKTGEQRAATKFSQEEEKQGKSDRNQLRNQVVTEATVPRQGSEAGASGGAEGGSIGGPVGKCTGIFGDLTQGPASLTAQDSQKSVPAGSEN